MEFSVFVVPVLNDKNGSKLLKIVFKVIFCHFCAKTTQFSPFFAFSVGITRAEKWIAEKTQKNVMWAINPDHKCKIYGVRKFKKKRQVVLGTTDKSKIWN